MSAKSLNMIIFFTIVLTIYFFANFYVFKRGTQAIPDIKILKLIYPFAFWFLASSYFVFRFIERIQMSIVTDILGWIGSFWLAALLYFIILLLLIDIIRLINYIIPIFPDIIKNNYSFIKNSLFYAVTALVLIIVIAGHINQRFFHVKEIEIIIPKAAGNLDSINAVLISDIHLGTLTRKNHLSKIVKTVNKLSPEIVFLAGDILDEDVKPVKRKQLGEKLSDFEAPLGVYAVMGNHEYIGGHHYTYEYLKKQNITVLRDTAIKINQSFYLIGREDKDSHRFAEIKRKTTEQLIKDLNNEYPIILMDHQPYDIINNSKLGIDLQVSGHTHHGQLWPLNFITSAMFEVSRGYKTIENMHIYVSNGIGTWGPPVRVGSKPEIVHIKIKFQKNSNKK